MCHINASNPSLSESCPLPPFLWSPLPSCVCERLVVGLVGIGLKHLSLAIGTQADPRRLPGVPILPGNFRDRRKFKEHIGCWKWPCFPHSLPTNIYLKAPADVDIQAWSGLTSPRSSSHKGKAQSERAQGGQRYQEGPCLQNFLPSGYCGNRNSTVGQVFLWGKASWHLWTLLL